MSHKLRIGTRGSALALWQADHVQGLLRAANPQVELERIIIKTEGDRDQRSSLTQIGGQGVFTKTIEEALLQSRIDVAVHSLKDLPSQMSEGLMLAAVPGRAPVNDVLVTETGQTLAELKQGAVVASGSIRRRSQLLQLRPDLRLVDLRGNIDTRLRKLREDGLDAIIMARAAIMRLELTEVRFYEFTTREMLPAVGQGAVGIQIRENDEDTKRIVSGINDPEVFACVSAERAFLRKLDSGCQFPVGALAVMENGEILLQGFVGSEDGRTVIREQMRDRLEQAENLGNRLAEVFIGRGALQILNNGSN